MNDIYFLQNLLQKRRQIGSPNVDSILPGEEFTNRCLVSILNLSSNDLRNDFAAAWPTSKPKNRSLESWYAPIVS
jgi:hypothetical protein